MADTKTYRTDAPPSRPTAVLRILYGLERGKRFELVGTEFTIGRGEGADIVLADPTIAEVHAVLCLLPTGARLRDGGSAAGLRVNGRLVDDEISLRDGAQIEIGGVVLAFSFTPAPEAAPAPEPAPPPLPPGPLRVDSPEATVAPPEATVAPPEATVAPPEATVAPEPTFTAFDESGPSVRIDTGDAQVRQFSLAGMGSRRIRIRSRRPLVAQFVSWFVILTVLLSAMWVIQTILYDTIRIPDIHSPAVAATPEDETVAQRSAGLREAPGEESTPGIAYGTTYNPPTVETPDRARSTFDLAMRAYWNDDTDEALATLQDLKRDHPDFKPPAGESVDQLVEQVETRIRYRQSISRAATAMAAQTATNEEMKEALDGLSEIPTTDPNFGPAAELYRQSLERRMEGLVGAGGADDADDADEDADDDESGDDEDADDEFGDDEFGDDDDDLADMALDEDGEVVEERLGPPLDGRTLMAQTKTEARRLYEEGRYADAARIYGLLRREDGLTRAQRQQSLFLERKLLRFGAAFQDGLELIEDPGTLRQGIRRLEEALSADRILFRFYEGLLMKEIADAHTVMALEALDRGDLVQAGEHMERGLARDAGRPAWDGVKPRVAALAMEHLDRARAGFDLDPARTRRILKQIVAASPEGSPAYEEASVLLEALDRESAAPALPAEATF